ncbi:MAG: hypothetical protein ACYCQI_06785 [Gammaproteobacteria bacterium]
MLHRRDNLYRLVDHSVKEEKKADSCDSEKRLDQALKFINGRDISFEHRLKLNKQRLEDQIAAFYTYGSHLNSKDQQRVQNCISLYCRNYPWDAGAILYKNIQNVRKSTISEMLIKAGADTRYKPKDLKADADNKPQDHQHSSFELAMRARAPASLLKLFIPNGLYFHYNLMDYVTNNLHYIPDDYEPIIRACLRTICHDNRQYGGQLLNHIINDVDNVNKLKMALWLIEEGADLSITKPWRKNQPSRYSTLYYAIATHKPISILQAIHQRNKYIYDSFYDGYYGAFRNNPVLLALAVNHTEAFDFYCQNLEDQVERAAYQLKEFYGDKISIGGNRGISKVDARVKLWSICKNEEVRRKTLDREIMSAVFATCTTLEQCIKQYESFDQYIKSNDTCSLFCKGNPFCADNARDLFNVASAKFCEVISQIASPSERARACEDLFKHHIFSEDYFKLRYNPQALITKLENIRNEAVLANSEGFVKKAKN